MMAGSAASVALYFFCMVALQTAAGQTNTTTAAPLVQLALEAECDAAAAYPCGCANCTMVCTKLQTQTPKCSYPCTSNSECEVFQPPGENELFCLEREDGGKFCASKSMLWVAGCLMSLAGSLISNFGLQVQKIAFNRQEERIRVAKEQGMEAVRKHMFCMPIWVLGLSAMVCGALLDFGSLSFAAQSLLAPLAASTLVINIIQAPCVVKEFPTKLDLIATFIITIGCVLSVAFADHQTITYSLDSMIRALYKPVFVLWMLMVITGMSVAYYLIRGGQQPGVGGAMTRIEESVAAGSNWYPFLFAALGGQSGGNSILFAKSLSEIGKTIFQVGGTVAEVVAAITCVGGLAGCMFIQLKFLNNGLQRFDVLFVLPIYQAFWIIGAAVNGMLFFEEYLNFSAIQYLMFPAGCICTISGVAMLSCNFEQSTNLNNNLGDKSDESEGANGNGNGRPRAAPPRGDGGLAAISSANGHEAVVLHMTSDQIGLGTSDQDDISLQFDRDSRASVNAGDVNPLRLVPTANPDRAKRAAAAMRSIGGIRQGADGAGMAPAAQPASFESNITFGFSTAGQSPEPRNRAISDSGSARSNTSNRTPSPVVDATRSAQSAMP